MNIVLVAETRDDWIGGIEGVPTIDPSDYLSNPDWNLRRQTKVYNLCRSYAYQSMGYYVSLLAEARGQRPIPDVMTIEDLHGTSGVQLVPQALEELIQKSLHGGQEGICGKSTHGNVERGQTELTGERATA